MLFCSFEFLYLFLPLMLAGYFAIGKFYGARPAKAWLVLGSLFFYGWFKPWYLLVIFASILGNFFVVRGLVHLPLTPRKRHALCVLGVVFNLGLLGYFKYYDFAAHTIASLAGLKFVARGIVLPLGISFFTFQQIICVVDAFREPPEKRKSYNLLDYFLFVTFFPQLTAGPIVHHAEMMPQFEQPENARPNGFNLAAGLHLFAMGLFKKIVIADFFAQWVSAGYANPSQLAFWSAWVVGAAYMFQIYFDFSAYSDMAVGVGQMFNIRLPVNFNSPLKAVSIQDFWKRWHITLGRFLMQYVYFPLGGSRLGEARACLNLFLVFVICGFWHGASWLYLAWGFINGVAMVAHRLWQKAGLAMPRACGWLIMTFFFITTLVFVRSGTWDVCEPMFRAMFTSNDFSWGEVARIADGKWKPLWLLGAWVLVLAFRNAIEQNETFQPTRWRLVATVALLVISVLHLSRISPFIYFNF